MHNRYYLMRHGRSKANLAGIILSDPATGVLPRWGLCKEGIQQVRRGLAQCSLEGELKIISSDFSRAMETAWLAAEYFRTSPPLIDIRLRERFFGDLEEQSDSSYKQVWKEDQLSQTHEKWGVESAQTVRKRTADLIEDLENRFENTQFLLVSHGDALQILLTWFMDLPASQHRSLKHLETAEIRRA